MGGSFEKDPTQPQSLKNFVSMAVFLPNFANDTFSKILAEGDEGADKYLFEGKLN